MEVQLMKDTIQMLDEARFQMIWTAFGSFQESRVKKNRMIDVIEALEAVIDDYAAIQEAEKKEQAKPASKPTAKPASKPTAKPAKKTKKQPK